MTRSKMKKGGESRRYGNGQKATEGKKPEREQNGNGMSNYECQRSSEEMKSILE